VSKPRAVTPDYPSVSNFDRDFLGLSSHSQWSSMLHLVRYHRSRFEGRYQAGVSAAVLVPLSPSPSPRPSSLLRRPLWLCHSRITVLGPAFRVLEHYRARHGAAPSHPAALSSSLVLSLPLSRPLSFALLLFAPSSALLAHLGLPALLPSHPLAALASRGSFTASTCAGPRSPPVRVPPPTIPSPSPSCYLRCQVSPARAPELFNV